MREELEEKQSAIFNLQEEREDNLQQLQSLRSTVEKLSTNNASLEKSLQASRAKEASLEGEVRCFVLMCNPTPMTYPRVVFLTFEWIQNQRLNQQIQLIAKETADKLVQLKEQVFQMAREEYQQSIQALKTEFEREVTDRIDREVESALAEKNAQLSRVVLERDALAEELRTVNGSVDALRSRAATMSSQFEELKLRFEEIKSDYEQLCGSNLISLSLDQVTSLLQRLKKSKKLLMEHREHMLQMKLREQVRTRKTVHLSVFRFVLICVEPHPLYLQEDKLKQIEEDQLERKLCVICMERKRETLCEPCGHVATCNSWFAFF